MTERSSARIGRLCGRRLLTKFHKMAEGGIPKSSCSSMEPGPVHKERPAQRLDSPALPAGVSYSTMRVSPTPFWLPTRFNCTPSSLDPSPDGVSTFVFSEKPTAESGLAAVPSDSLPLVESAEFLRTAYGERAQPAPTMGLPTSPPQGDPRRHPRRHQHQTPGCPPIPA